MSKIWKWLLLIAGIFAVFVGFNMHILLLAWLP